MQQVVLLPCACWLKKRQPGTTLFHIKNESNIMNENFIILYRQKENLLDISFIIQTIL